MTEESALARPLVASFAMLAAGALSYPLRGWVPLVVRGQLADILWAAAFGCALLAVTRSVRWGPLGLGVAELLEVAQIHPRVPGTFDPVDMIAIAAGFAIGCAVEARLGARSDERPAQPASASSDASAGASEPASAGPASMGRQMPIATSHASSSMHG